MLGFPYLLLGLRELFLGLMEFSKGSFLIFISFFIMSSPVTNLINFSSRLVLLLVLFRKIICKFHSIVNYQYTQISNLEYIFYPFCFSNGVSLQNIIEEER